MSNRLHLPSGVSGGKVRVRSVVGGRVIPCVWSDCRKDGDDRIHLAAHMPPDEAEFPGQLRIYIFCSTIHRDWYVDFIEGRRALDGKLREDHKDK